MTQDYDYFDGSYAPFAKVTEGMEIIDQISKLETTKTTDEETGEETESSRPVNPPVIKNITVDTFGVNYGEPETNEVFDAEKFLMQKLYGVSY